MQGKVANLVETEQLVELTAQGSTRPAVVSSFVQIRGSIPLLWSQIPSIKYKPTTRVSPPSAYEPAFDNHINDLLSSYQVNLQHLPSMTVHVSLLGLRGQEAMKQMCRGLQKR